MGDLDVKKKLTIEEADHRMLRFGIVVGGSGWSVCCYDFFGWSRAITTGSKF